MKVEMVELAKLNAATYNPRNISKDQLSALAASLSKYGFVEPVVVNRRNMTLVGGHQRAKAWAELGESVIPVVYVNLDDAEERALNLALNKISGTWDQEKLSEVIRDLKAFDFEDFQSTGFSLDEINDLGGLTGLGEPTPPVDPNTAPEPPKKTITQEGDVYEIGVHRLICGDHGSPEVIKHLMASERANLVLTDPPYNIGELSANGEYGGDNPKANTTMIRLKNSEWDKNFSPEKMLDVILSAMAVNCSVYLFTSHHLFGQYLEWTKANLKKDGFCVWAKPNPAPCLGKRHWTSAAELVVYGTKGKHTFNFPDGEHAPNVWNFNKPSRCDIHPTMKPVELFEHIIRFSSKPNDIVLDVCGGSGTTMVASERTDRKARLIERSPEYCDAIVARMKALFPELPVTRNGKPF